MLKWDERRVHRRFYLRHDNRNAAKNVVEKTAAALHDRNRTRRMASISSEIRESQDRIVQIRIRYCAVDESISAQGSANESLRHGSHGH